MRGSLGRSGPVPDLPTALAQMLSRSERPELRNLADVLLHQHAFPWLVAMPTTARERITA